MKEIQIFDLAHDRDIAERKAKEYEDKGYTLLNIFFVPLQVNGKDNSKAVYGKYEGAFYK